jgi:predicted metal-binding protein
MPCVEINYDDLIFDEQVQTYCNNPKFKCPNYGHSWACPPEAPYLEEEISKYKKYFLIYSEYDLKAHVDRVKLKKPKKSEDSIRNSFYRKQIMRDSIEKELKSYVKKLKDADHEYFILWDGHCRLCEKEGKRCTYDFNIACRYPDEIRYSMEAIGINVTETVRNLNFGIEWPPKNFVYRFGIICVK